MVRKWGFIFLFLFVDVRGDTPIKYSNSSAEGLITFLASSTLTRNRPYLVVVSVGDGAKEPVNIKIDITSRILNSYAPPTESTTTPPPVKIYGSERFSLEPSQSRSVKIMLRGLTVDENSPGETMLALKVSATGGIKFEEESDLTIEEKSNSLLIQTDKPLYKPGEVIRMRVVNLDRGMKPVKKNDIEVNIKDPTGAIMKIWKNAEMKNLGLFSDKFKLSPEPNLGHWTIEATSGKETVSRNVLISEYVLPKFKVELLLPPFATFNDSKVTLRVKGSYTYGKSVKGNVVVSAIGPESYNYIWRGSSYERPPQIRVDKTVTLEDGVASLTFDLAQDLKVKDDTEYIQQKEVTFKAILTESATGLMENDTKTFTVYRFPYKIEHISRTEEYKPGLPYQMTFKVDKQDGTPLMESDPEALKIRHGFSYDKPGSFMTRAIPKNGIVTLTFIPPTNDLINVNGIEITYKGLKQTFYPGGRATSISDTFIQLTLKNEKLKVNDTAEVMVKCTRAFNSLRYILTSKSEILKSNIVKFKETLDHQNLSVQLPHAAAPHAFLLIYLNVADADNEVVADVLDLRLDGALENYLNLSLTKNVFKPGESLEIQMETKEDSIVALRGIDQSVLLLKEEDSDLTMNMITQELDKYDHNHYGFSRGAGMSFNKAGILIMTNGALEKNVRYRPYARRKFKGGFKQRGGFGGPPVAMAFSEGAGVAKMAMVEDASFNSAGRSALDSNSVDGNQVQIRKNFPETWLWEEISADEPISTFKAIVPDTITSWVISGFSLNADDGIGICTGPQTLKTFRAFFIRMNNPYSVVKGETIGLQILVANYMKDEVEADIVVFNEDNEFKFVMKSATKELKKHVKVPSNSVISVTFLIVPTKIGTISLKARGVTKMAGDAIEVPLIVKGPGERITKNEAALIDQRNGKTNTIMKMEAKFPMERVEGADTVRVSIIGDILGPAIKNLDNLIQLPVGCGEQNMLYFVPDIVVMQYLTAKGMLTKELKTKLTSYLEEGYQRELRYKRPDGSYSAFGNDDQMGSTWLTAFVVKSFVAAMEYITIDQLVITESLNYLKLMQGVQGGFEEKGHVLHSELKGGVGDKNIGLTAYVTLTFLELPASYKEEYGAVTRRGLEYVMKNWENLEKDQYVSILTTYILHKAKDPRKDKAFRRLEEFSKKDSAGLKYWSDSVNSDCDECTQAPAAVEMTSYALLIYLKRNMLGEALPVVKWLLKQRNSNGGFHSTQDTVVGLTALAKFAALTSSNVSDLAIRIKEGKTMDSLTPNQEVLRIKKENLIVQQELILNPTTRFVQFEAEGEGISLVQLTWSYNTEETSKGKNFQLKTDIDGTPVKFVLNVCASYLASNESNMVVMEINLPTGYAFPEDVTKNKGEKVKRADLEKSGQTLMIYFEKMNETKICSSYTITRVHLAANQAPTYVLIYDYYVPSKRERIFYKPPVTTVCDLCDDEECRKNNECNSNVRAGKPGQADGVEPDRDDGERVALDP